MTEEKLNAIQKGLWERELLFNEVLPMLDARMKTRYFSVETCVMAVRYFSGKMFRATAESVFQEFLDAYWGNDVDTMLRAAELGLEELKEIVGRLGPAVRPRFKLDLFSRTRRTGQQMM